MQKLHLFVDASANTQNKTGFGAYLYTDALSTSNLEELKKEIRCTEFKNTSSTKLELENLLFALEQIDLSNKQLTIYSDSQNILSLLERRENLEVKNYYSKSGKLHQFAELYKAFFARIDTIHYEIQKVKGHKASKEKSSIEQIFTLVDRASRKALRKEL